MLSGCLEIVASLKKVGILMKFDLYNYSNQIIEKLTYSNYT